MGRPSHHRAAGSTNGPISAFIDASVRWKRDELIAVVRGVTKADNSVKDEAPIFLIIFAVPAVAAVIPWLRFKSVN